MDIAHIRKNYSERSTEGLAELLGELSSLREDAIFALKDELISRNDEDGVQQIDDYLASSVEEFTTDDAKEYVLSELANGQSLDVIRLELIERGINIFDIVNDDENLETEAMLYMTELKEQGASTDEVRERLNEEFVVVDGKEGELLKSLKRNGNINIFFGILLLIIGSVLLMGHLYLGRLPVTSLILIVLGIWRLSRGFKQRK